MAEILDDAEFWLPSEFLSDDFFLEENAGKGGTGHDDGGGGGPCFPSEFPYGCGYGSNLSSPVESVTDTESDEEDYMAGLTRQMAKSFLHDGEKRSSAYASDHSKPTVTVGSPQSTLCAMGIWNESGREGPDAAFQASSPPSTLLEQQNGDAWDLLYAAAGQMVRMRLHDEDCQTLKLQGRGLLGPPRKPSPPVAAAPTKTAGDGYYANPSLTQYQLQGNQFQQLKQQQLMKQQCYANWSRQNRARGGGGGYGNGRSSRPPSLSFSGCPPLQQQQPQVGSGMRAVFLGGSGLRRASSGTGVFLPRRVGNSTELRKKPACSTVLLPARVVQALNLSMDDMRAQRLPGGFVLDQDAIIARSNAVLSQRKSFQFQPTSANHLHHEARLPPDWTY